MCNIILDNENQYSIELDDNPLSEYYKKCLKHLQHIRLNYSIFDYPKYRVTSDTIKSIFLESSKHLGVNIDIDQLTKQDYLNYLHGVYEVEYPRTQDPIYLDFHEMIHLSEACFVKNNVFDNIVTINFRNNAGLLQKTFDRTHLSYGTTKVRKGTCFLRWNELGKTPYSYFIDNEPDNIDRLCELAKPWTTLRPALYVALEDVDFNRDLSNFNDWFRKYEEEWKSHWGLHDWSPEEQFTVISIGVVREIDDLEKDIESGSIIVRVTP
jgi:hypothetical protein